MTDRPSLWWGVVLDAPDGPALADFYAPPRWPTATDRQQMMMHLDLEVEDLDTSVAHALECGAALAAHQPQDNVRVLLDPAGHPFCHYVDPQR